MKVAVIEISAAIKIIVGIAYHLTVKIVAYEFCEFFKAFKRRIGIYCVLIGGVKRKIYRRALFLCVSGVIVYVINKVGADYIL